MKLIDVKSTLKPWAESPVAGAMLLGLAWTVAMVQAIKCAPSVGVFKMHNITCTTERQEKKVGTKTVFITVEKTVEVITEERYNKIICADTLSFFRRLGGSEYVSREYTCCGYKIARSISTSPDKEKRTIRTFDFEV